MLIRISDTEWINPAQISKALFTKEGNLILFLAREFGISKEDGPWAKGYHPTVEPKYMAEACKKLGIECYVVIKDGEATVFATDVRPSASHERT